jgi:hypothetical protein
MVDIIYCSTMCLHMTFLIDIALKSTQILLNIKSHPWYSYVIL